MEHEVTVAVTEKATSNGWHTAPECRERAESWENEEIKACINHLMKDIWEEASKGGTTVSLAVRTSRSAHFYKTLQTKMEKLGFQVVPPSCPGDLCVNARQWVFRW